MHVSLFLFLIYSFQYSYTFSFWGTKCVEKLSVVISVPSAFSEYIPYFQDGGSTYDFILNVLMSLQFLLFDGNKKCVETVRNDYFPNRPRTIH